MQQASETKMVTQIGDLISRMKREEVPECWLITPEDIENHEIDELMEEEEEEAQLIIT